MFSRTAGTAGNDRTTSSYSFLINDIFFIIPLYSIIAMFVIRQKRRDETSYTDIKWDST